MKRLSLLALACFWLALPVLGAEDAPAPAPAEAPLPAAKPQLVLTGDFVEVGPAALGGARGQAWVEIVNLTPFTLSVQLGEGAGRIEPRKSLGVRLAPGRLPLLVSTPELPRDRIETELVVAAGRHYAIALQHDVVRDAPPGVGRAASGDARAPEAATRATASSRGDRKKSGRVDIGRKRKKDRGRD